MFDAIYEVTGISQVELTEGEGRAASVAVSDIRKIAAHILRERFGMSQQEIAGHLGRRNRTSARHAIRMAAQHLQYDATFRELYKKIESRFVERL